MNDHDHISDLRWDRLLAGDLAREEADAAHAHAHECASCGARLRELTADRDAFKLRPVGFSFAKPARRIWWWGAPIAALAAALVLIVVRRPPDDDEGERTKGGSVHLLLLAGPPDRLAPVTAGDAIHPGDHLQAGYTAQRDGFGAVLSIDGAGTASIYVPARGDAMVALPAGTTRSFPASTVLDDVVGSEHIAVLWCETARPLAPLLAELRSTKQIRSATGCTIRTVTLDKRAAP